jgi:hypothetical protein
MFGSEKILLPSAYFAPISYMALVAQKQEIFIEQMETFPRQTYRNRCEILTSAGKLKLVIPVSKPNGNHTITRNIEISYREPWQQHHWKSMQSAYRSSPYFNYYSDILQPIFEEREKLLIDLNQKALSTICRIIGINLSLSFTDDYIKNPENVSDLRSEFTPKRKGIVKIFPEYPQVFSHKSGFMKNLSVLDLIFNLGPEAKGYLLLVGKLICKDQ